MPADVLGEALHDFYRGNLGAPLSVYNSYGDPEKMPVDVFFRDAEDFPELEHIALQLCDGHVLDVGAGAGSHALHLQSWDMAVTALEYSPLACSVMQARGVRQVVQADFFRFQGGQYDTLLFMMNGIGIAGSLNGLPDLLRRCRALLRKGGQLLIDSSDIAYLYADYGVPKPAGYYGEIRYQYAYKGLLGTPFHWLFIDQETLIRIAQAAGWIVQVLYEDEHGQYLARMEPVPDSKR